MKPETPGLSEWLLARWLRFWTWVAVFACARLNARLWDEAHTYVVTQTGEPGEVKMAMKRGPDPVQQAYDRGYDEGVADAQRF